MTTADDLEQHICDAADQARGAMASVLASLHAIATGGAPGMALRTAGSLQASVNRMEEAMSSAHLLVQDGDDGAASIDCARVMVLSDYTTKLARLRTIAAQIEAYDDAHSGNVS